jgi:uncharacterized protein (TIGR00255 family)
MTGFGRAEGSGAGRQITVEIKSLNGKGFDLNTGKLPLLFRAWESEIRNLISKNLTRGTVDLNINVRQENGARVCKLNMELAVGYHKDLQELAARLHLPTDNLLPVILNMPDIYQNEPEQINEADWSVFQPVFDAAIAMLVNHRKVEGAALEKDLKERMAAIEAGVKLITPLEPLRIERVKERLQNSLQALGTEPKDANRFEQELIYYLEKMDVSEEKTRLAQHISYFLETLAQPEGSRGKVLGFILQEIGREINTLGSKANDAKIQQIVVGMKDELEKAKEQVLNVL